VEINYENYRSVQTEVKLSEVGSNIVKMYNSEGENTKNLQNWVDRSDEIQQDTETDTPTEVIGGWSILKHSNNH